MNKINGWMVIALSLGAVLLLLLGVSWLTVDWGAWGAGRSGMYDATPRTLGHVFFSPLMLLMPLVWLALPICAIVWMIRWLSGEPRWRCFGTGDEHSRHADGQVCPYCGQSLEKREVRHA